MASSWADRLVVSGLRPETGAQARMPRRRFVMNRTIAVAALLTLMLSGAATAADEPRSLDIVPDDQFCHLVADDPEACAQALATLASAGMLPQAFAVLVAATEDPSAAPAELGGTQHRDDVAITVADVVWGPESLIEPEDGMEHVSLLVSYEALDDVAASSPLFWGVADEEGLSYAYSAFGQDPALVGGSVRADRGVVEGWVTFEVPSGTSWLEVSESRLFEDPLRWVVER